MLASGFSWFHLIPAVDHDTLFSSIGITKFNFVVLHAWLAAFVVVGLAIVARISLERAKRKQGLERYMTDTTLTPRTAAEIYAGAIMGMMGDAMPKKEIPFFFPFIGGVFAYILFSNLISLVPGLLPPTDNVNNNVGIAIVVFIVFNAVGLIRDPVGYLKHLWGPVWWLGVFMFPLEVFSLFLRPMSLTLRLTGNMFGDHMVFGLMSSLVPFFVPTVFLMLACFVSAMQAFVFSLLSSVYIGLSLPHEAHGEHH